MESEVSPGTPGLRTYAHVRVTGRAQAYDPRDPMESEVSPGIPGLRTYAHVRVTWRVQALLDSRQIAKDPRMPWNPRDPRDPKD